MAYIATIKGLTATAGAPGEQTATLALAVVVSKGIPPLINAVVTEPEDHIKSASAWSLGQIGRHSPDHAKALADANALPKLKALPAVEVRRVVCGGCGVARYCSEACQIANWGHHQKVCAPLARQAAREEKARVPGKRVLEMTNGRFVHVDDF